MKIIKDKFNFTVVRLNPGIRLRRESFGGLVFDTRNGNILEVDKSTFLFLNLIKDRVLRINDLVIFLTQNNIIKKPDESIDKTLQKLLELEIIQETDESPSSPVSITNNPNQNNYKPWLSAPETVHWAVTYRCNENCPDCYVQRLSFSKNELDTREALKLIDKIAHWGVFQLALGGGEPFTREDLPQLVSHAANQKLAVHITTGMRRINHRLLESVIPFIKNLQFGIRPDDLLSPNSTESIQHLFAVVQGLGIKPGANLFLTGSVIEQLENIIKILSNLGFNRIILLRYKPPDNIQRWKSEKPDSGQTKKLHEKIHRIIKKIPQLDIRIDCALSFLQRDLPKKIAEQSGIKGCVAADRILALAPDGSVYPCSQLVHPQCYAGNLLESEPETIWNNSRILRKYRSFRTKKTFTQSWCGVCQAKHRCGGCRVFAPDGLGSDPDCPEPLLPPLTQLGKVGKNPSYLENYPEWIKQQFQKVEGERDHENIKYT